MHARSSYLAGRKIGGYGRMSKKKRDGRAVSVVDAWDEQSGGLDRQTEDISSMVVAGGGDPDSITWYIEDNTSAFKKKKVKRVDANGNEYDAYRVIRPVWHTALHALRTGQIDCLVVWDLDRLARDLRDLEDGIEVVEHFPGTTILSATASSIDLTTDAGRAWARVMVTMNNKQSADTARRVKREHASAAQAGIPRGGTRPFGYEDDKSTIRPDEAALIREAAELLLGGSSLSAICRDWEDRGVVTSRGNPWNNATLRLMLLNPRLAGWRARRGEIVTSEDGKPVRGLWEPVLDQETFDRLSHMLTSRDTVKNRTGVRKYMLSGILRCGVCNTGMTGNYRSSLDTFQYKCNAASKRQTGHSLSVSGPPVDAIVSAQVGLRVVGQEVATGGDLHFDGDARLKELDQMIEEAMAELRANPSMSRVIYAHVGALEAERLQMQERRSLWLASTLGPPSADVTADEWLSFDVEEKRAHVLKHLEAIVVSPATRPARMFDPERLVFVWRQ